MSRNTTKTHSVSGTVTTGTTSQISQALLNVPQDGDFKNPFNCMYVRRKPKRSFKWQIRQEFKKVELMN